MPFGLDPETVYVSIYCEDSHPDDRWMVATYFYGTDAAPEGWAPHRGGYAKPGENHLIKISAPKDSGTVNLIGNTAISSEQYKQDLSLDMNSARVRFGLKCGKCSTSVAARRENIEPIFDKLAAAGIREVSLTAIAARLKRR